MLSALFFAVCFTSFSCARNKNAPLINTDSDIEAMRYGVLWAVITEPYASFRETSNEASLVSAHGRRGDVERVVSRALIAAGQNKKPVVWYGFSKGWLNETSVIIYSNKLKAQKAAGGLQ
jgi:hypothetical protein